MPTILVIDDDEAIRRLLEIFFRGEGYDVEVCPDGRCGFEKFVSVRPAVVLLDQVLPDADGLDVLKKIKDSAADANVVMITGHGDVKEAVKAMAMGAFNYLQKPLELQELKIIVRQLLEISTIKKEIHRQREKMEVLVRGKLTSLYCPSARIREVMNQCDRISRSPTPVLLQGESGTGKGLTALFIHQQSDRHEKAFVEIDCTAIPETLLESELFGYEAGAFTDARKRKEGLIEIGDGGTLFFDEIGDLPLTLQAKLLKVIEEKTFRKLGSTRVQNADIRIIAATNSDLPDLVRQGRFRKDLFYRINVFTIVLPALRDRQEDIIPLAERFLAEISREFRRGVKTFGPGVRELLARYDWPGNIRELKNTVEKAVILARDATVSLDDLRSGSGFETKVLPADGGAKLSGYRQAIFDHEKQLLEDALARARGNQSTAARILGINRNFLLRRAKKLGIDVLKFKRDA